MLSLVSRDQRLVAEPQPAPDLPGNNTEVHVKKQAAAMAWGHEPGPETLPTPVSRQAAPGRNGLTLPSLLHTGTLSLPWQVLNDTNRDKMRT